ncbi:hypothetical protein [Dyadobacter fermentans]|uniref:DUF5640 domain-containing protein n=1 Tax=Dyadobacter fermentans (strain ATCC 700827 / DSM 18053 / CIP 107007 / KCTC 52180 / NS114) TaxID=471854 RepID=C6VXJ1_DYAFD|nr:hypothetical protein [Dyadobacter fermentans]ACT93334.1 hypothetical protein Dfer_2111 [Dyadobacter fermentans DSM 18053]
MKVKYLLTMILALTIFAVAAKDLKTANDLIGTWKYTVSNVPPEYETGVMTFEEKDNKTTGYLGQQERMEMKELTVDQGKVTFKLDFQGGILTVTMTQDGDKLSGTIVSQDGEFPITAVKEPAK